MSWIGLRVGPFEVEREVTVPAPGDWYRAVRTGMTRKQPAEALVRVLSPEASPDERQELLRAFENLRSLDDARVPAPIAFYEGTGALAVQYVEGTPLRYLVEDRRADQVSMTPGTLLDLALELADGLQHAHHKGKWHGHLWPGNVTLGADGHLWVWGFGEAGTGRAPDAWIAPERARGLPATGATDQWSLAATIAAWVTGQPPWRSADPLSEAQRGDSEPAIALIEAQWPALGRLLHRMMDPAPENRYPSLHPVRGEILALARKAGASSERHKLGTWLADRHPPVTPGDEPVAPPPIAASAPHFVVPDDLLDSAKPPTPAADTPIPSLARPLGAAAPAPLQVVAPDLADEVPLTRVDLAPRPDTAPAPVEPFPAAPEPTEERSLTEVIEDRAGTEVIEDRAPTEVIEDRAATEVIDPDHLGEREPTEMVDFSPITHALVAPVEEPVEDPISESRDSFVKFDEVELHIAPLVAQSPGPGRVVADSGPPSPSQESPMGTPPDPKPTADAPPPLAPLALGGHLNPPVAKGASSPPPGEDDEDTGDAATVQYNINQMMTILQAEEQPETASGHTPAPAPSAEAPPRIEPLKAMPSPLPTAATQPTMPPQPPPVVTVAPTAQVAPAPAADASPTMVPLTDPGADAPPPSPLTRAPIHVAGPSTDTGLGTDAGFFRSTDPGIPAPTAPLADAPTGPSGLPTDLPPPSTLPETKPAPILKIAPLLAVGLLLMLLAYTLYNALT